MFLDAAFEILSAGHQCQRRPTLQAMSAGLQGHRHVDGLYHYFLSLYTIDEIGPKAVGATSKNKIWFRISVMPEKEKNTYWPLQICFLPLEADAKGN